MGEGGRGGSEEVGGEREVYGAAAGSGGGVLVFVFAAAEYVDAGVGCSSDEREYVFKVVIFLLTS